MEKGEVGQMKRQVKPNQNSNLKNHKILLKGQKVNSHNLAQMNFYPKQKL